MRTKLEKTPELAARLSEMRKELGLSQVAFAKLLGVNQSLLAGWESGARPISRETMLRVAEKVPVPESKYWLRKAGVDVESIDETVRHFKRTFSHVAGDMLVVPIRTGAIAAGHPLSLSDAEYEGSIALPLSEVGETRTFLAARVRGDSMSPRIMDGDLVVIDTRSRPPKENVGKIVAAVDDQGGITIKTLGESGGKYFLVAANSAFTPQVQPIDMSHRWSIAGRVVYWIGKPPTPKRKK